MLLLGIVSAGTVYNHKLDLVHAHGKARDTARRSPRAMHAVDEVRRKTWAELVQSVVVARSDGDVVTNQVCVSLVSGNDGRRSTRRSPRSPTARGATNDGTTTRVFRVQVRIVRSGDALNGAFFRVPVTLASSATAKLEQ
jgi:hypothetical protein